VSRRRVAFVTGASRGIGRASALALAARGFDLVLCARTRTGNEVHEYSPRAGRSLKRAMPGSLEETAQAIREHGGSAAVVPMDLLERSSVEAAAGAALAAFGRVDVLVNNAVYQGPGNLDRVADLGLEDVEAILRANVVHQLLLVQRILPSLLERGEGAIVNLVSAAGMGDPPVPADEGGWGFAYAASKAAFQRLAGVLAVEHAGRGVSFFNVEPGLILTESMRALGISDAFAKQYGGAPPEVPAAVIAWLASDPRAAEWHAKTVHAQRLCKQLGLVPGWPEPV
jgi:NAD(P)-dependent dehydrogenase (short-subunit alcohol dehydrogenase family)